MNVRRNWDLVTSHGLVLCYIARGDNPTMGQMARGLSMTERRISSIVRDLGEAGLIKIERRGRRNAYALNHSARFRHPTLSSVPVKPFLEELAGNELSAN